MNNKKNKVFITGIVITILGIAVYSPIVSFIMASIFLISVIFIIKGFDPLPFIIIFSLSIIASFDLIKTGYLVIIGLSIIYLFYFLINKKYRRKIKISKYYMFFYILIVYVGVQLIFLPQNESTWEHVRSLVFGVIIIWLMSRIIYSKERLRLIYLVWGVCIVLTIIVGYWEIFTGDSLRPTTAYPHLDVATVGFYNQNNYSFYLALSLPIIFYWLQGGFIQKVAGLLTIGSIFYLVYVNDSRSVILMIFISLCALIIKLFISGQRALGTTIIMILVIAALLNVDLFSNAYESIYSLNNDSDVSMNKRKELTISGVNIFKENPILGVGPGNSEYYMFSVGDKVHNFWLEILINYVPLILIGLISFFLSSLVMFFKNTPKEIRELMWPLLWTVIIFIPTSLTPSTIFNFQILWFLFGLMLCANTIIKNTKK